MKEVNEAEAVKNSDDTKVSSECGDDDISHFAYLELKKEYNKFKY